MLPGFISDFTVRENYGRRELWHRNIENNFSNYTAIPEPRYYATPYHYIGFVARGLLGYSHTNMNIQSYADVYSSRGMLKMISGSALYFTLGLLAFKKRKMENTETSFKSLHIHNIVRCLTILPFILLTYHGLSQEMRLHSD